jgi:hypothetical protein
LEIPSPAFNPMRWRRALAVARVLLAAAGLWAALGTGPLRGQAPAALVTPALETALRQGADGTAHTVWVYLRDKGARGTERAGPLSVRAVQRRARRTSAIRGTSYDDQAIVSQYVDQVAARVTRLRHTLRWFNAISVEATAPQVQALAALPFVERLDLVRREARIEEPSVTADADGGRRGDVRARSAELDYGTGLDQVAQLRVPELHRRGVTGAGVLVALFDTGFPNLDHEALATVNIVAQRDFVSGLETVRGSTDMHGLATLSVIAGYSSGHLIGPAYGASYVLAITEDTRSERPVEEDNWAAAAEWAEAMGVDVISSSLGYSVFDLPYPSYSDRDMDGNTAITTRAATMAAARGVVVVNSAGNGRRRGGELGRERRLSPRAQHAGRAGRRTLRARGGWRRSRQRPLDVQFGGPHGGWTVQAGRGGARNWRQDRDGGNDSRLRLRQRHVLFLSADRRRRRADASGSPHLHRR